MDIWGGTGPADRSFDVSGLRVHVLSHPYHNQDNGGDIYYISMCGSGRIARIAVADVSGHGDAVSTIAQSLRSLMRKHINTPNQARFARSLNEDFQSVARSGTFATAVLATYWAPASVLILVNAGHPPPLLYRRRTGKWAPLTQDTPDVIASDGKAIGLRNLPLGVIDPTGYDQFAVRLEPDDLVILHTDAMMETRNPQGQQLGLDGLIQCAQSCDANHPETLAAQLFDRVRTFSGGAPSEDDQTVLVLHHTAAEPDSMSIAEFLRVIGRIMGVVGPSPAASQ